MATRTLQEAIESFATRAAQVGTHGNAWSAANVGANGNSAAVDLGGATIVSIFGVNGATISTFTAQVSQDGTNWYATSNAAASVAASGAFHFSFQTAARYVRVNSSAATNPVTVTIAGKAL